MLDITKSQANQQTVNGVDQDWVVSLDGEELYTLPAYITPPDIFVIRDAIQKMMEMASAETRELEREVCENRISHIVETGNSQLTALKEENERLATAFEQHILSEEVI